MKARQIPFLAVFLLALTVWTQSEASGQIIVPDRLQGGGRMGTLITPADQGVLPFDSLPTLPSDWGSPDNWWHRHALFMDGAVRLAMDPVVDYARDVRRFRSTGPSQEVVTESGFRNIRGVRYSGTIDGAIGFGGKVLEMQRRLTGPDTEWVLAAKGYPGMGPGKLRPEEGDLYGLDHSLAEVWFDLHPSNRIRLQWGIGSIGMGPGARNLLWNADMAPAPYLLAEVDMGRGWQYRWWQSRQRSTERLPSNGTREGRYAPLGLAVRSIGKTWCTGESQLHLNWVVARWTDVAGRGEHRSAAVDWALALAPWSLPAAGDSTQPLFLAGHHGLDVQWRRPHSTWYAQVRCSPWFDPRYAALRQDGILPSAHTLFGHVRHGERWTVWTEFSPTAALAPASLDPASSGGSLGTRPLSPLQPDWIQGIEWRPEGMIIAAELGRLDEGWSWKTTISLPSASADVGTPTIRRGRKSNVPNRWWPALVPFSPFLSIMGATGTSDLWWSAGVSSPVTNSRKTH